MKVFWIFSILYFIVVGYLLFNKDHQPYIYIDCNSYEMEEVFERMAEIEAYVRKVE